jgi:hypothetical protein
MACPASAHLELAIPNWTPPIVDPAAGAKGRGTRLHKLLADVGDLPLADLRDYARIVTYVAELRSRRRFQVLTEHTVTAEWLKTQPNTTADLVLHTQDELHVVDYKFGRVPVELVDNEQLLFYAACYAGLAPRAHEVHLHVLQPAADVMEEWVVSTSDLVAFVTAAQAAEDRVLAGDTTFGPSKHCTFCPANPHSRGDKGKPMCPAMMQILYPAPFNEDDILDI